jgi:hypothetical protein
MPSPVRARSFSACVALVAAYALVLAGVLAGVSAGISIGPAALCLSSGSPAGDLPPAPPVPPRHEQHAACCVDCSPSALAAFRPGFRLAVLTRSELLPLVPVVDLRGDNGHRPGIPRAPPPTA